MEQFLTDLITKMVMAVIISYQHNWLPLGLAIITAAVMKVYVDPEKLKQGLLRRPNVSIWASVAVGALTPLCACGTMAVIIGMLTTTLPWGPIMAFLTSSPLMSPNGFILDAGLISLEFAIALTISSIIIGLGSGYLTHFIERKTDFLKEQTRFTGNSPAPTCGCSPSTPVPVQNCGCAIAPNPQQSCCSNSSVAVGQTCCGGLQVAPIKHLSTNNPLGFLKRLKWREIADNIWNVGIKQILLYFTIFVALGSLITYLVPNSMIVSLFGAKKLYGVPLAALIGLPLYITTEAALPLVKALLIGGASGGAMLAFLITGPGTSAYVIAGMATFMKRKALMLYVLYILAGGILCGYLYDLFIALRLLK
ncbi:MAG TPA: hypothetical protein DDW65_13485 [Firmicutes bacterium]|jgi:uncharacterized protein|nr:hypothetical protein [Bacillota bacterium]